MRQIYSPLDGFRSPFGRLMGSTAPFTPAALFALAEPGVWYDPSDLTTLFQDTAGTLPVTTPGQTVALALDKSKGLVLGSELNGLNWSAPVAGISYAGGVFTFDGVTPTANITYSTLTPTASIVAGRTYLVTYRIADKTEANGIRVSLGGISGASRTANGTYREYIVATNTSAPTFGGATNVATRTGVVDNISVKELPGFHATQATLASRPTYGIVPLGGRRNLLLNTDTMATQSRTVTAVAHTLSFTGTGTVTLSGASTAGPLVGTGVSNRVSLTFTPTAASLTMTVSGSVTLAQLELGSTVTNYQRVGTSAFDVTEAGVASLSYLSFDGVDDTLNTSVDANTILGVSGTDPGYMVVGGVLFNAATGAASAFGRSAFCGDTAGYFGMWAHTINGGEAGIYHWDTGSKTSERPYTIGSSVVVTGRRDPLVGASGTIYGSVNAVSATGTGAAALSGLASTFTIGRQFNTYMNGQLFGLIVRGVVTIPATVGQTQAWVAEKSGVTL